MKYTIFAVRMALGWIFFYAGISKLLDPSWSAAGFLNNATTLHGFYRWLASPGVLPIINFVNKWALLLLGVSLLIGLFVRLSSSLGIILMVLYYVPQLNFPYVGKNYLLIDEHVIFALGLLLLIQTSAGKTWGLDQFVRSFSTRFNKTALVATMIDDADMSNAETSGRSSQPNDE